MGKKSNQARFPVARIKKLIQADEDVGKVAQGTPIVVSKALELFLGSLVAECVKDAQARGSTKISAHGLKRTVNTVSTFDFCADIVADVPDPIGDDDEAAAAGRKKRAPQKKKKSKKADTDDEDEEADYGEEEGDAEEKGAVKDEEYDEDEEDYE